MLKNTLCRNVKEKWQIIPGSVPFSGPNIERFCSFLRPILHSSLKEICSEVFVKFPADKPTNKQTDTGKNKNITLAVTNRGWWLQYCNHDSISSYAAFNLDECNCVYAGKPVRDHIFSTVWITSTGCSRFNWSNSWWSCQHVYTLLRVNSPNMQ